MSTATAKLIKAELPAHLTNGRARASILGVGWSVLHTVVPSLSAALVFFLSAAILSYEDFGRLAIAGGLVSIALAFSPVAFGEALVQRSKLANGHADAVFWCNIVVGLIYFATLALSARFGAAWFNEPQLVWLVPLLALKVPFELAAAVPNAMIIRAMRFRAQAIRTAVATTVGAVLCVALLLSGYGLVSLAISQVAVSAAACCVAFWVAGWRPGLSGRLHHLKELCGYTIFASGDRMLGTLRVDHLVAGALGGSAFLGLLTFAQRFFRMLADFASGAIGSVTHVVLSSMQGEKEKARKTFLLASFAAATVGFPTFAGAALIIDDVINLLFGPKWLDAQTATQVFCLGGFLATPGIIQGALIRSQGRPNWWFYYQLMQQVGTVLVIAATFHLGVTAVAIGIIAKTVLLWPVSLVMTVKILECRIIDYARDTLGPLLATVGMAGVLSLLPMYPGWFGVAMYVGLGAVIYTAFLVMLCHQKLSNVLIQIKKAKRA